MQMELRVGVVFSTESHGFPLPLHIQLMLSPCTLLQKHKMQIGEGVSLNPGVPCLGPSLGVQQPGI